MLNHFVDKLMSKFNIHIKEPAKGIGSNISKRIANTYRQQTAKHSNKLLSESDIGNIKRALTPAQQVANKLGKLVK